MLESSVYIIIPVFNRWSYTKRCLSSISKQDYKKIVTIVVNDGSTDATTSQLKKKFPKVIVINGTGNWWWSRSMNEGIKHALDKAKKEDYILEMNNDCFLPKNYLRQLLKSAKVRPHSVIGSICVRDENPNIVVEAGVRIDWKTGLVYGVAPAISNKLSYFQKMRFIEKIDALPGKGTLIPVKVFKKIGLINHKRLPHYIADYEFAIRASRAGYELLVDTKSILKHHFEATGISSTKTEGYFGYRRAISIILGRKSMNNIIDWINFLFLACPKNLLALNLYMTSWRMIYGATSFFPFNIFRPLVIPTQRLITKIYQLPKKFLKK